MLEQHRTSPEMSSDIAASPRMGRSIVRQILDLQMSAESLRMSALARRMAGEPLVALERLSQDVLALSELVMDCAAAERDGLPPAFRAHQRRALAVATLPVMQQVATMSSQEGRVDTMLLSQLSRLAETLQPVRALAGLSAGGVA